MSNGMSPKIFPPLLLAEEASRIQPSALGRRLEGTWQEIGLYLPMSQTEPRLPLVPKTRCEVSVFTRSTLGMACLWAGPM